MQAVRRLVESLAGGVDSPLADQANRPDEEASLNNHQENSPGDTTVSFAHGSNHEEEPSEANSQSSGDDTISMGGGDSPERGQQQGNIVKSLHDLAFYSSDEESGHGGGYNSQEEEEERDASDDDDASSDDNESVYELPKACMETNEVGIGSLVRVSWDRTTGKKRKTTKKEQLWGEIIGKRSETSFDVQCEQRVLRNVSIDDMLTLESPQMKDEKLDCGDIVYAAWPGTNPKTELCYWGKVKEVTLRRTKREGNKKFYSIIFFPTEDSHGLVDVTEELASEFIYRKKEALFLMENADILGTSELPSSSRMTLQQLIQQRQKQEGKATAANEEEQVKETKQKARAPAAKRKAVAAAASKPKKQRKVAKRAAMEEPPNDIDALQDPESYELSKGDLVYAPYPNAQPEKERWFWGSVARGPRRRFNTIVVDVKFSDGLQSLAVKRENLYKLESQDYKDSVLCTMDKVYSPWPGENPESEPYYWGRIVGICKKSNPFVYTIKFPDGDVTKKIESSHFHRYAECIHMMEKGWLDEDWPKPDL